MQNRARRVGAGADDLRHPIHPGGQRILPRRVVQSRPALDRVDDRHVERLDQQPVKDRLAGVVGQVEYLPGLGERLPKGRPIVNGEWPCQRPLYRVHKIVLPGSIQVNDVAGDA